MQLPRLELWQIVYVARSSGRLPPLVTTAIHGGLGHALYHVVCVAKARESCRGCPVEQSCAYPQLFDPPAGGDPALRELGVTNEPPRPFAISPEPPFLPRNGSPFLLQPGHTLRLRLVATPRVREVWPALQRALRRAGRIGFGERRDRVTFELEAVECVQPEELQPSARARLEFVTPLRIKNEGRVASSLSPQLLFEAIQRRAALLARLQGLPNADVALPIERLASLSMRADLRLVRVRRFSSTQRRTMEWPGLMGTVELEGAVLPQLWPWLVFAAKAQIGKATTFGFGRFELFGG